MIPLFLQEEDDDSQEVQLDKDKPWDSRRIEAPLLQEKNDDSQEVQLDGGNVPQEVQLDVEDQLRECGGVPASRIQLILGMKKYSRVAKTTQ